ncbi:hypothetical protein EMCRGX_G001560 [Ephydatia muelleri]
MTGSSGGAGKTYGVELNASTWKTWWHKRVQLPQQAEGLSVDDARSTKRIKAYAPINKLNDALFKWFVANEASTYMSDALITEATHHLFDNPEAVKVMTEVSRGKPALVQVAEQLEEASCGLHQPNVIECVPEERIFNVDESGLLYKQKPKYRLGTTEALKGMAGKKDENAKERITVNFALNATGTIKTPLQVINKAQKPKYLGP